MKRGSRALAAGPALAAGLALADALALAGALALAAASIPAAAQDPAAEPALAAPTFTASAAWDSAIAVALERETGRSPQPGQPPAVEARYLPATRDVYAGTGYTPAWFTPQGARPALSGALALLRSADRRGLEPADYDVDRLAAAVAGAETGERSPGAAARADVALTATMLRFLTDLRAGRARPGDAEPNHRQRAVASGFAAQLPAAIGADRIAALADAAEPSFPQYGRLKRLLAHYRMLAAQPLPALPALPPKRAKIEPGESYEGAAALHRRLVLLGDLPGGVDPPADGRYAEPLVAAVRRFQERHGLAPDGVLGRATLAELNAPLQQRVEQLRLSLERLRWLPDFPPGPLIAVNIPSFRLWSFADARATDQPVLTMPVIVGRAVRTETPVFIGDMRYVEFSPYWNVPPSILRNEVLPTLRRNPGYLQREDMELVSTGSDRTVSATVDAAALAALESGALRVRQRPGPRNALDGVKFVLPNTMDIYLHGTPAPALFERARRDFSHGCVRVADPAALARFVLREQPEWTAARIDAAMAAGKTTTVTLARSIPVVVFYTTAIAGPDDRALFLADLYGHDRKLDAALRAARAGGR